MLDLLCRGCRSRNFDRVIECDHCEPFSIRRLRDDALRENWGRPGGMVLRANLFPGGSSDWRKTWLDSTA